MCCSYFQSFEGGGCSSGEVDFVSVVSCLHGFRRGTYVTAEVVKVDQLFTDMSPILRQGNAGDSLLHCCQQHNNIPRWKRGRCLVLEVVFETP